MNSGHQQFLQTGSRFAFQRETSGSTVYPLIDLGVVEPINLTPEVARAQLFDSWGGVNRLVAEGASNITERYSITCSNMNMDNLSLLFMGTPPAAITQTADAVTDIRHTGIVGRMFQLLKADGTPIFNVASIQAITEGPDGTPVTLVAGEDYEIVNANLGWVRLLAGGATNSLTADDQLTLDVDYTPTALTGKRIIKPQTGASVQGRGYVFYSSENHAFMHARWADVTITPSASNFQNAEFSNFGLEVTVRSDPTDVATPAGELVYLKGDLPDAS